MLKQLRISNYAIINEADIRFSESMNIITGETGAGKSILLGALSLILGERANTGVLFNKEKKCVVEGVFQIGNYHLNDFFIDNEIDYEEETIIRRELTDNGKSRAFINDTPVNLQILQSLADKLITVHSQHETMALGESAFQLMVIDALAETGALRKTCKEQFLQWKNCSQRLKETEALSAKALIEKDFIEFQFAELDQAGLDAIDQTALENEHTQLTHAVEIKQQLSSAVEMLENGPSNIIDNLHHVIAQLQSIVKYAPDIESYIQRLSSSVIELKDIVRDLEDKEEAVSADPKRTEDIQQQLNILFRLQKKHHCNTIEALIILRDELGVKLSAYINSEETIALLKKEQTKLFSQVASTAKKISEKRQSVFTKLETSVNKLLQEVGMKDAQLKVSHAFDVSLYLSDNGADHIQYLFSANKGSALQDIKKVASGGELSRLMLCIKSLLAKSVALPTLIFDEIDTGVSGAVANKVGNMLMQLSANHQLIAITHLPQIASRGLHHLFVYKESKGDTTFTRLKLLSKEERLLEIAKMLSGETPTKAAMQNAAELLQ